MNAAIHARMLIATVSLLAVATSASAEAAWVLWGQIVDPWNGLAVLPLGRWSSMDACEPDEPTGSGLRPSRG